MLEIITASGSGLSRQALKQRADKQQITRLLHGTYVDTREYEALNHAEKYRVQARAFLQMHKNLSAWGITAAALKGAPILLGADMHFSGAKRHHARSRQKGCIFHETLPVVPAVGSPVARMLFECTATSPLPDALLAANHLLRCLSSEADGGLFASRDIDEKSAISLLWEPLDKKRARVKPICLSDVSGLNTAKPDFLERYTAARNTMFASPDAELAWLDFALLCAAYGTKRGVRKALSAGLLFSDQTESPAESLLVARCAELGFAVPFLQVNIIDPKDSRHLGRVDGLWPSPSLLRELYQRDDRLGRRLYCKQPGDNDSVIIEFDGRVKYQDDYAGALEKERLRQNAISNLGFRFIRIGWDDLMRPEHLRSLFLASRVPRAVRS